MSERSLQRPNPNEINPNIKKQILAQSNRVVIFGSRLSGAFDLADSFEEHLKAKDVPNSTVVVERNISRIESAFYGNQPEGGQNTLPKGVVVLPEMRWYPHGRGMTVDTNRGKFYADKVYDTVLDYIRGLCDENEVPMVDLSSATTQAELIPGVEKILKSPDQMT